MKNTEHIKRADLQYPYNTAFGYHRHGQKGGFSKRGQNIIFSNPESTLHCTIRNPPVHNVWTRIIFHTDPICSAHFKQLVTSSLSLHLGPSMKIL